MSKDKVFWTTKEGVEIDIDQMTIDHLRNTLKMIVRVKNSRVKKVFDEHVKQTIKDVNFEYDE